MHDQRQVMFDAVPLPLVQIGADGRIAVANGLARAAFGGAIVGRPYLAVFRQPLILDALEGSLRLGQQSQTRVSLVVSGRETSYRVKITPVPDTSGTGALLAFEDVGQLEQAEAIRRDFVANVSHELRTPLTALMGFVETLRGAARDDPEARERFLAIMERETARMSRLVQDLLSLSRVEAEERMQPDRDIDVLVPLRSALSALRPAAEASKVALTLTGETGPLMVLADADQITQVFTNLVENAIKYGGAGKSVSVHVSRIAHEPALRHPAVRIDVIDQGEGIDPVHIPRLTERFYRVDAHRSRENGGTGLGLAIVKHIVNRHRGRFRIDSVLGKGSQFSVILPES